MHKSERCKVNLVAFERFNLETAVARLNGARKIQPSPCIVSQRASETNWWGGLLGRRNVTSKIAKGYPLSLE